MEILESVKNPFLLRTYEILEDKNYFYIVSELSKDGDFFKYFAALQESGQESFEEETVKFLTKQLLTALSHMHDNKMIHRDIKLENLLIHGFRTKGPRI